MSIGTAASPGSTSRAVVDASAFVRAQLGRYDVAEMWLEADVSWPSLAYVEVSHTLLRLHRQKVVRLDRVRTVLQALHTLAADVYPVEKLARPAWDVALSRGLSAYDACYVVLAEGLGVPLVTADRRLAEATPNGVLL